MMFCFSSENEHAGNGCFGLMATVLLEGQCQPQYLPCLFIGNSPAPSPHVLQESGDEASSRSVGRKGRRSSGGSASSTGCGSSGSVGVGASRKRVDMKAKLERSRQSARECRARKKLRYQYLEELVADREKAVMVLRRELDVYRQYFQEIDEGNIPEAVIEILEQEKAKELGGGTPSPQSE